MNVIWLAKDSKVGFPLKGYQWALFLGLRYEETLLRTDDDQSRTYGTVQCKM